MSFVYWKFERYAYNGIATSENAWSSTAQVVSGLYDPTVTLNLGDAKDSLAFKVTNFNSEWSNYFRPNDQILVYRKVNSSTVASSDVLINGTVQNTPETESGKSNIIRVECGSFSESVFAALAYFDADNLPIDQALQRGIQSIKVLAPGYGVTWASSLNPSTTSTGAAFPDVQEKLWPYKPLRTFVEKYSSNASTGDGNYYWFVNKDREFVWGRKSDSATGSFNSDTGLHKSLRINKDLKDVKNLIILKGGISPKGAAIQDRVQDISSIAKNGIKPYIYIEEAKTAETLLKGDMNAQGVTSFSAMSFPFVPSWSGGVSYATDTAYDNAMVAYVKTLIRRAGQQILEKTRGGKLKVDLTWSPGEVNWGLGEVVACTIPSLSASVKNLRVQEIVYSTEADTYTMVEDIGSI